jgi:hypothetical protein
MTKTLYKRDLYVLLTTLKREGREKIELRELMKRMIVSSDHTDDVIFVLHQVATLGYKVKICPRVKTTRS